MDDAEYLQILKNAKCKQIDVLSERFREKYVTGGPIQIMVYDEKYNEVIEYVAKQYPTDLQEYPYIQAEVNVTGEEAQIIADNILERRSKCMTTNVKVEQYRLAAKKSIHAAIDSNEIDDALQQFDESMSSIML